MNAELKRSPFSIQRSAFSVEQGGFSLLEVMIAMMVLAVGLLAVAGMQGMSITRNVDAGEISVATNLAADIVERIRFNRANVTAYNNIDTGNTATQPPTTQPQARGDYNEWRQRLDNSRLTSLRGRVTVLNPLGPATLNQSEVAVNLTWTGRAKEGVAGPRTRNLTLVTVVTPE